MPGTLNMFANNRINKIIKQNIMNIYLGNVTFNRVFEETGYKLTEEDKKIWNKYHSNKADLSEKESCFHIF